MPGSDRSGLPEFDRPPVIETVLGVHFKPVRSLTSAHLGLFWHSLGRNAWPKLRELPPITPQIERFDVSPTAPFRFSLKEMDRPEVRLRMDSEDGSRVVQIQSDLLLTHWVRTGADYPRYSASTRPEFLAIWEKFCNFLAESGFPQPEPIQWEVTYIDRVPTGELWNAPSDWASLFNGLVTSPGVPDGQMESALVEYHYRLNDDQGRLHVEARHVAGRGETPESLDIVLTARGSLTTAPAGTDTNAPPIITQRIGSGLDVGRHAIVRAFRALASEKALAYWGHKE